MNLSKLYNENKIIKFKNSLYVKEYVRSHCSLAYSVRSTITRFPYLHIENILGIPKYEMYDIAMINYNGYLNKELSFECRSNCEKFIDYIKELQRRESDKDELSISVS